jgi:hypothetical protein
MCQARRGLRCASVLYDILVWGYNYLTLCFAAENRKKKTQKTNAVLVRVPVMETLELQVTTVVLYESLTNPLEMTMTGLKLEAI